MKIFLAGYYWTGNWIDYCAFALQNLGHTVKVFYWNNVGGLMEELLIKRFPYIPIAKQKIKEIWNLTVGGKWGESGDALPQLTQ